MLTPDEEVVEGGCGLQTEGLFAHLEGLMRQGAKVVRSQELSDLFGVPWTKSKNDKKGVRFAG